MEQARQEITSLDHVLEVDNDLFPACLNVRACNILGSVHVDTGNDGSERRSTLSPGGWVNNICPCRRMREAC